MIETRGKGNKKRYVVRVDPYKARTVYTIEAARTLEANLKNRKALGDIAKTEPTTLEQEITGFNERRNATNDYRHATEKGHQQISRAWKPLRAMQISSLSRQAAQDEFVRRAKTAPVQADKELSFLKAVLREAEARGQRVDPGIYTIKPVNKKPRRGRALTIDQLVFLSSWLPEYLRRIVLLGGMIGARQSFWFQLTDEMLDLDASLMIAPARLMKNGLAHMVVLTPREVTLFREQLLARPAGTNLLFPTVTGCVWSRHNFRKLWKAGVDSAAESDPAVAGFTFHLLRHTAGSLMAFAGLDPASAAERMGHTDGGALFLKTYRHMYEAERRKHAELFGVWVDGEWDKVSERQEAASGG